MANIFYIRDLADAQAAQRLLHPSIGADTTPRLLNETSWGSRAAGEYQFDDSGTLLNNGNSVNKVNGDTLYIDAAQASRAGVQVFSGEAGADTYRVGADFGAGAANSSSARIYINDNQSQVTVNLADGLVVTNVNTGIRIPGHVMDTATDFRAHTEIVFANGASIIVRNTVAGSRTNFVTSLGTLDQSIFIAGLGRSISGGVETFNGTDVSSNRTTTTIGGENTNPAAPPTVAMAIADITATAGSAAQTIDLNTIFTDANPGYNLTYSVTATASNGGGATTSIAISGSTLTIDPMMLTAGTYTVTVTADDGVAGTANVSDEFTVTINAAEAPPRPPTDHIFYIADLADANAARALIDPNLAPLTEWTNGVGVHRFGNDGAYLGLATVANNAHADDNDTIYISTNLANVPLIGRNANIIDGVDTYRVLSEFGAGAPASFTITDSANIVNGEADILQLDAGLVITNVVAGTTITFANGSTLTFSPREFGGGTGLGYIHPDNGTLIGRNAFYDAIGFRNPEGGGPRRFMGLDENSITESNPNGTTTVGGVLPNRPPTVTDPIDDIEANAGAAAQTIDLNTVFTDPDPNDSLSYSVSVNGTPIATTAVPGIALDSAMLTVDPTTLAAGAYMVAVTADDSNGGTVTDEFSITVNALPTLTGANTGAVAEDGTVTATGDLSFADAEDANADITLQTVASGTGTDISFNASGVATVNGTYGTFTLTRGDGTLGWSYALNNTATNVQALFQGQEVMDTLTLRAVDDDMANSADRAITVTITGTNDDPVITVPSNGGQTFTDRATPGGVPAFTFGNIQHTDPDAGEGERGAGITREARYSVTGIGDGTRLGTQISLGSDAISVGLWDNNDTPDDQTDDTLYGNLIFNIINGGGHFEPNQGALDGLAGGESIEFDIEVTVTDAARLADNTLTNGTSSGTLTIRVVGDNDATAVRTGGIGNRRTAEDTGEQTIDLGLAAVFTDPDSDLSYSITSATDSDGDDVTADITLNGSNLMIDTQDLEDGDYTITIEADDGDSETTNASNAFTLTVAEGYAPTFTETGTPELQASVVWAVNGIARLRFDYRDGEAANNGNAFRILHGGNNIGFSGNTILISGFNSLTYESLAMRLSNANILVTPLQSGQFPVGERAASNNLVLNFGGGRDFAPSDIEVTLTADGNGDDLTAAGGLTDSTGATNSYTVQTQGTYGTFTIDNDGVWSYTLNREAVVTAVESGTAPTSDTITLAVSDGMTTRTVTHDVAITIAGANTLTSNRAPVVSGVNDITLTDVDGNGAATVMGALTGTLTATDDSTALGDITFDIVARAGTSLGDGNLADGVTVGNGVTNFGTLTLNASNVWEFTPNQAAINALNAGTVTLNLTATGRDDDAIPLTGRTDFTITINGVNDATTLDLNRQFTTVAENVDTTMPITIATLTATDPDSDAPLRLQNGFGRFALVGNELQIVAGAVFDFETTNLYNVVVSAGNATRTIPLTIANVNEAPMVAGVNDITVTDVDGAGAATVTGALMGTLTAIDQDTGNTHTFGFAAGAGTSLGAGDLETGVTVGDGTDTYGTLTLNANTGAWEFTPDQAAINTLGARTITLNLRATATDNAATPLTGESDFSITVTGVNDTPSLTVDSDIAISRGASLILTSDDHLMASDVEDDDASLTYTLTAQDAPITLQRNDAGVWTNIAIDGTFTQEQVDDGEIRLNPMNADGTAVSSDGSFTVRVADSGGAMTTAVVNFTLRTAGIVNSAVLGSGEFDLSGIAADLGDPAAYRARLIADGLDGAAADARIAEDRQSLETPRMVETGIGDNAITTGSGDDVIDAGAGDDVVDLRLGGSDEVIYRFEPTATGGGFVARDGGDRIMGFTLGEDSLTLQSTGAMAEEADTLTEFIAGLGTAFDVRFDYALTARGDGTDLMHYDVTGVELHFPQAVLLPGGRLSGSILEIDLATPMAWNTFLTDAMYLGGNDAFDAANLQLMGNTAGREALARILGLDEGNVTADTTSRGVIIGTEGVDTIDASGATVIFGRAGSDTITLGAGVQEVVYTLEDDGDGGNDTTSPDCDDTIMGFDLGTDTLRFVDIDASDNMGEAPTLTELLGRFDGVSLTTNGMTGTDLMYTGIRFLIDDPADDEDDGMTINFATALTESALIGRLDGITDATGLNTVLATASENARAFTTAGLQYVDDLFATTAGTDDDNISITNTLPTELL